MNKQISIHDDKELILQLLDDVALIEQALIGIPTPSIVRTNFVPILRRWIVDGLFSSKVQKLILPNKISFDIHTQTNAINLCQSGCYEHWMGTINFGTIAVTTGLHAAKYLTKEGRPKSINKESLMSPLPQYPNQFFKQKILFLKDKFYTREEIIKMLANTFGGVHLDLGNIQKQPDILKVKNYLGFKLTESGLQMLIGSEIDFLRNDPEQRPRVYDAIELIAIDTARIFVNGIQNAKILFTALL
jgi:hypothetical protein